jgi:hypothetical protein
MPVKGIPNSKPVIIETTKKARKGFTLAQVINRIREMIARIITRKVIV